jgi:hypothetical protein
MEASKHLDKADLSRIFLEYYYSKPIQMLQCSGFLVFSKLNVPRLCVIIQAIHR